MIMQKFTYFIFFSIIFFACNDESVEDSSSDKNGSKQIYEMPNIFDYYYPRDTTIYMYVYQNTRNVDDQFVERVVYKSQNGADHFFVSRYTMNMTPISNKTYWVVDGMIELMQANIMVGKVGYKSKITSGQLFPLTSESTAKISYDYPMNDSIINLIEVNRKFERTDSLDEGGNKIHVAVFADSMRISHIDTKNKQHQQMPAFKRTYYGQGIGKVMEENGKQTYRLILRTKYSDFKQLK